jgi:hypothetical protein
MRKLEFWAGQNRNGWQRVIHHRGHTESIEEPKCEEKKKHPKERELGFVAEG